MKWLNGNIENRRVRNICGSICILSWVLTGGIHGKLTAQSLSAQQILQRVDDNIGSDNKISLSKMIIHGRRGSRTIESKSWIQGSEKSYTEYLAPAREAGTKMLKLGDELWTYTPSTDRIIRISGHLLRQSVMGSDLSYEDMMEDKKLNDVYNATIEGDSTIQRRSCWELLLTVKTDEDVAYDSRRVWVDKERFVTYKENRYAKSGKLLKTTIVKDVRKIDGRWVPTEIVFKDVLKAGDGTTFIINDIEFNATIPDYIFSKAVLRR
ncbi:outer membrane lipoprotein-sorting protein [candidate division KSB1 bacterium]|nr:outer membrane lipoprotein-sorting protein [candidate division KSB1 bacterium]